jgi:RimJ/RimL family protein N-acetyltransferase
VAVATLRTDRLTLRQWRDSDRGPFAAINADPRVMEFFLAPLTRSQSDAVVDRFSAELERGGHAPWALERNADQAFIGFTGFWVPRFEAHFTPCVEIGWRLAVAAWGRGYATEAAFAALGHAFGTRGLDELVSFTPVANERSIRVMERIGMTHDPADDFDHPSFPVGHPLRRHVLYRLVNTQSTTT